MNTITKKRVNELFKKMTEKEVLAAMVDFYRKFHRPITKEELVRWYL